MGESTGRVIGLNHLFLPHSDFEAGWSFWTEVLGLQVFQRWGEPGHEAGLAGLGGGHVVVSGEPVGPSDELGTTSEHGVPLVFLQVDDLDAFHARVVERGGRVLRAPFTTHWGSRAMTVAGPDGLVLGFCAPPQGPGEADSASG